MSIDLERLEVVLRIQNTKYISAFYAPVLTLLGYTETDRKPGLSVWTSQSRCTSLVLTDTAIYPDILRDGCPLHTASRLTFTSKSARQIDRLFTLLQALGATILICPQRYGETEDRHGVVFRYYGGAIMELKLSRGQDASAPN